MTLLAPFADRDARINGAVQRCIANATAVYQGGAEFGVLFERSAVNDFEGAIDAASQKISFPASCAPGIAHGGQISVNGVAHTVDGQVQPDATGWLTCAIYPTTVQVF